MTDARVIYETTVSQDFEIASPEGKADMFDEAYSGWIDATEEIKSLNSTITTLQTELEARSIALKFAAELADEKEAQIRALTVKCSRTAMFE